MPSILWLTGPAGVGKSTVAWHVFSAAAGEDLGYVDVDQVGMLYPDDETDEYGYALKNAAIKAIAPNYTAAGANRLLVSGVVDPREAAVADRLGPSEARHCLLTVDDDVLHRRVLERGWDVIDADKAVAEQAALASAGFADTVLDTTNEPIAAVGRQVLTELTALTPAPAPRADGDVLALRPERTVFITGPRAVGCSTSGFGLASRLWSADTRTGFADLGQLSFRRTPPTVHHDTRLGVSNLAALAALFASRGAEVLVGNGHLCDEQEVADLRLHLPGVLIIRLRADPATLQAHILDRAGGNDARLTGDDLADAEPSHRAAVLAQATQQQEVMERAGIGDVTLDVTGMSSDETVAELARLAFD